MPLTPSFERLESLLIRITETPAPTFAEHERGDLIERLLRETGAAVERDPVGNVVAHVGGTGPKVVVAAHLDTVFPAGTDVSVRREGDRLKAPGIGDNSASLAVLVHYVELARSTGHGHPDLVAAATVGEEGLGDLRGARRLVADRSMDMFIALDGHLGTVVDQAVGSKRYEVDLRAAGGHSWGDYPSPSAVHAAGDVIHALNGLTVPTEPRSSYNVGEISGGRSVNAIAEQASFNLDLRSLDPAELDRLASEARKRIERTARAHGVEVEIVQVGDRPAGRVDNAGLVRVAREALDTVGQPARVVPSSTDANAAIAAGVPAIGFGAYRGGDAHRTSEWLEPASLLTGFEALARLLERIPDARRT